MLARFHEIPNSVHCFDPIITPADYGYPSDKVQFALLQLYAYYYPFYSVLLPIDRLEEFFTRHDEYYSDFALVSELYGMLDVSTVLSARFVVWSRSGAF